VITINGKLYVKGGNGGSENLRRGRDAGSAQVAVTSFGRAVLRGSATVLGGDGGNSASASDNGGTSCSHRTHSSHTRQNTRHDTTRTHRTRHNTTHNAQGMAASVCSMRAAKANSRSAT
jgi:hypothetical protein